MKAGSCAAASKTSPTRRSPSARSRLARRAREVTVDGRCRIELTVKESGPAGFCLLEHQDIVLAMMQLLDQVGDDVRGWDADG